MSALATQAEKRSYPRVHLFRPMLLEGADGAKVKANLRKISPVGLQAMCDRKSAQALVPDGRFVAGDQAPRVTAHFSLPIGSESFDVAIECRMAHVTLVEEEGVAIGLSFLSFDDGSLEALRRFILQSLEPV